MKALYSALVLGLTFVATNASPGVVAAEQPVEIRDGVLFEKNVSIPTDDGAFLMSNVIP